MPREARYFLLSSLRLLLRRLASRLEHVGSRPMVSLSRLQALQPLFGFLSGSIHFLVRPILDSPDVRRGSLSFLICSSEAGSEFDMESFELTYLPIAQNLQPVPLLDQIFPEGFAVVQLTV